MSTPAAETHEPTIPGAKVGARPAGRRRLVAVAFIVLGAALLASNLGLLAPEAERVIGIIWPAALIVAGLWFFLTGASAWAAETASFAVERGQARQAQLLAALGTADLQIGSPAGGMELAAGDLPLAVGHQAEVHDSGTTLRLQPHFSLLPLVGARWSLALAAGLPWRLNLRSSTGNLDLNLRDLSVTEVRLRSTFGDVALTLPAAGGADLDIGLVFGDLTISVPNGLGVKVKLQKGPLAGVEHDERRFIYLAPQELGTPLYAVAAQRCTLSVWLGTGDLDLQ